jgi:hypothetical protein
MIRDPNCPARDLTKWFGWAFTLDKSARLVGQHNADSEEELLDHFRSVATGPWAIAAASYLIWAGSDCLLVKQMTRGLLPPGLTNQRFPEGLIASSLALGEDALG